MILMDYSRASTASAGRSVHLRAQILHQCVVDAEDFGDPFHMAAYEGLHQFIGGFRDTHSGENRPREQAERSAFNTDNGLFGEPHS